MSSLDPPGIPGRCPSGSASALSGTRRQQALGYDSPPRHLWPLIELMFLRSQHGDVEAAKDLELTPRAGQEQWRFTPSMLDPNSCSFAAFANQPPGYYTPTPGGMNTVYHNQAAGDLHTPGLSFHLGTPLSLPLPDGTLHVGNAFDLHAFQPQLFHNHPFPQAQSFNQQQAFPPSLLVHHDSGYAAVNDSPPQPEAEAPFQPRKESEIAPSTALDYDKRIAAAPPGGERYVERGPFSPRRGVSDDVGQIPL
jgi:hypothetical protein